MPNIGLIGAGALGSRHLQSLALSNRPLNIIVMDPSELSLKKAEELFYQIGDASKHKTIFTTDMLQFPEKLDAVIVATSSNVRKVVIEQLVAQSNVKALILEKVLFQKIEDYKIISELLTNHNIKAWVNCPRRQFNFYNKLRGRLINASSIEISISGSAWGLGCNAIHFLDLIAYLSGSDDMEIDITGLEKQYINSKRPGFLEIAGTITGKMGRCKSYSITSYFQNDSPISIQITSDILKCVISEEKKKALVAEASNNWDWTEETFQVPFQSQLTNLVLQDILDTGNCNLTDYDTSMYLHIKLQEPLIQYFTQLGVEGKICPIT
jgi:hypothetical protein